MKEAGIIVLILISVGVGIWLYFMLKPYVIKHRTINCFTGELGAGKTCEASKETVILYRLSKLVNYTVKNKKIAFRNWVKKTIYKIKKKNRSKKYLKLIKKGYTQQNAYKKLKPLEEPKYELKIRKPKIYSNIPLHYKEHWWSLERKWSAKLQTKHLILLKPLREYSVIFTDELPQFLSQFDWESPLVQTNFNEFCTFFRHYIGGYWVATAQDVNEIECHIRRKMNVVTWISDMHIWPCRLLPLFYTNRMCDMIVNENVTNTTTTQIEENTRIHFGFFPKGLYDTRCFRPRYFNIKKHTKTEVIEEAKWDELTTMEVLRLRKYISPLDTSTTDTQWNAMEKMANDIERNKDHEIK